jgi:uncharacterized OB-fold protein
MPRPDDLSRGYWEAAARHELAIQRCDHCGWYSHPPDVVCPNCLAPDPSSTFAPVSGRGVIRSWTVMRDAFLPAFREDVPWVVVDVELEEQPGLSVISRLVDGADADVQLGRPVRVVFHDVAEGVALPEFELADDEGAGA